MLYQHKIYSHFQTNPNNQFYTQEILKMKGSLNPTNLIQRSPKNPSINCSGSKVFSSFSQLSTKTSIRTDLSKKNLSTDQRLILLICLEKLVQRRKSYMMQLLKQFILYPDDTDSSKLSVTDTIPFTTFLTKDEAIHRIFKLQETKQFSNKLWAFLNLKYWHTYKQLVVIVDKVDKIHKATHRIHKKQSFQKLLTYSKQVNVQKTYYPIRVLESPKKQLSTITSEPSKISVSSRIVSTRVIPYQQLQSYRVSQLNISSKKNSQYPVTKKIIYSSINTNQKEITKIDSLLQESKIKRIDQRTENYYLQKQISIRQEEIKRNKEQLQKTLFKKKPSNKMSEVSEQCKCCVCCHKSRHKYKHHHCGCHGHVEYHYHYYGYNSNQLKELSDYQHRSHKSTPKTSFRSIQLGYEQRPKDYFMRSNEYGLNSKIISSKYEDESNTNIKDQSKLSRKSRSSDIKFIRRKNI